MLRVATLQEQQNPPESNVENNIYYEPFERREIRHNFTKRVFLILIVQLAIIAAIVCFFAFHEPSNQWLKEDDIRIWLAIGSAIVYIVVSLLVIFSERIRKTFIMLYIVTITIGFLISCLLTVCPYYSILLALGCTFGICICITIFACQTRYDFTILRGSLICVLFIVIFFAIFFGIMPNRILELLLAFLANALVSVLLILNIQIILRGQHLYTVEPDEYILGALSLYMTIFVDRRYRECE